MSRVIVTGGSGFIGRAVTASLLAAGHAPRPVIRRVEALSDFGENVQPILLSDLAAEPEKLAAACKGASAIVHLADNPDRSFSGSRSIDLAGAVLDAAKLARVPRIIFTSSIYARLDEEGRANDYGAGKHAAEELLMGDAGVDTAVLRLPPVYGPGAKGGIAMLAGLIRRGLPLPFALARAPRDYLALANLTNLVIALVEANDAAFTEISQTIWEPSDGAPISTADLARLVAAAMDRKARLVPVPRAALALPAGLIGRKAQVDAVFEPLITNSDTDLRRLTGWQPSADRSANLAYLST